MPSKSLPSAAQFTKGTLPSCVVEEEGWGGGLETGEGLLPRATQAAQGWNSHSCFCKKHKQKQKGGEGAGVA